MILKHYCCVFAMKRAALRGTEARQDTFTWEFDRVTRIEEARRDHLGGRVLVILPGMKLVFLGFGPLLRELFQSFFQPVTDSLNGVGFLAPL
jgi:hypothetical protein